VLLVLTAVWSSQELRLKRLVVGLVLLLLALWRYMEQRFKASNQAYWAVITLTARDRKLAFDKPAPAAGGLTHAGGVVYRMRGGQAQYLLVEAKDHPKEWVLPKGHIEEGEQPRETAVREVHEETGVWGKICRDLSAVSYPVNGNVITVQFFLMECLGLGLRSDVNREHMWSPLPLKEAIKKATYPETQALLQSAEQFRVRGLREGFGP
jgi:ADP-ribose pyrophosphatase YjhB (NUDIX family)